jgi:hypothetical protein
MRKRTESLRQNKSRSYIRVMSTEKIHARPQKITLTETVGRMLTVGVLRLLRSQAAGRSTPCARPGGIKPPSKPPEKPPRKDREQ